MRVPQVSERIKEAPAQALRGVFAGIGQLLLITDKIRHKTPADQDVPRARAPETAETITDTPVTSPAGSAGSAGESATAAPAAPAAAEPAAAEPAAAEPAAVTEPVTEPAEAAPAGEADAEAPPAKPAARRTTAEAAAAKPATAKAAAAKAAATRRSPAKPATATPADPGAAEAPKPPKRQSTRNFDKTGNVRLLAGQADSPSPGAAAPDAVTPVEPVTAAEPVAASQPVAATEPVTAAEPAAASGAAPLPNYDALTVASLRARLRNLDLAQVRQLAAYERSHAGREDVLGMYERRIAKLEAEAPGAHA